MKNGSIFNFGERIKSVRERVGYTQDYISGELGISQKAYSKIETNETTLKGEVLIKLAEILKVDLLELIPTEAKLTYNNVHSFQNGNGIVYDSTEKLEALYKQLLDSKDEQIRLLKEMIELKK
jgi:transcriptional regulator with XRE-family HTH domain